MILCLDYGARYVGLAITDPDQRLALRYATIDQKDEDALLALANVIHKEGIGQIIVGLPVNLKGRHTQQTRETLAFIDKLRQRLSEDVVIATVDETLTSVEAGRRAKIEGLPNEEEHAEAARLMLADYLKHQE